VCKVLPKIWMFVKVLPKIWKFVKFCQKHEYMSFFA
jgi:hypothetical protein